MYIIPERAETLTHIDEKFTPTIAGPIVEARVGRDGMLSDLQGPDVEDGVMDSIFTRAQNLRSL